jgi:hypothetical protein
MRPSTYKRMEVTGEPLELEDYMEMNLVFVGYGMAAFFTAGHVYYNGVSGRLGSRLFGPAERLTLLLACMGVGAFWILFTPVLAAVAVRRAPGHFSVAERGWAVPWTRAARVRG